jgi:hypothetical protein
MSNFMMNMVSWILLLLVILTLYLIDKVNHIQQNQTPEPEPMPPMPMPEPPTDILFAGLEGKKLWDAMNGKPVDGFDAALIDALRAHYEPILREHITETFRDGMESADETDTGVPASQRKIPTVRGFIQSWLPPQHLGSIYRVGIEYGAVMGKDPDPDIVMRLRETLDSVTDMLYKRTSITYEVPFSELLMSSVESEEQPQVLALTDESANSLALQPDVTPNAQDLAQGLEQVQMYEEQQRQDLAAEQGVEVIDVEEVTPAETVTAQAVATDEGTPEADVAPVVVEADASAAEVKTT